MKTFGPIHVKNSGCTAAVTHIETHLLFIVIVAMCSVMNTHVFPREIPDKIRDEQAPCEPQKEKKVAVDIDSGKYIPSRDGNDLVA